VIFERLTQLSDPEPHSAALNMAIDEWLLRSATSPVLRVYGWARPSVSFGYFMKYAEIARQWPGRDLVRRWTGGGVVLHGTDLTYTLVVPRGGEPLLGMSAGESYRVIHELIASALGWELSPEAGAKVSEACFENPVQHDVLMGQQKVAGAAQRRTRFGLLHQGSIELGERQIDLARLFCGEVISRSLGEGELMAAQEIAQERYAQEAWTQRF
jgi:lipoyl(octanoyl) transferase